ncbi:MAG: Lrp/AsnC family transcriptional regulator [Candidatus Nanoarchaeia archaeon]|nr:Lrp/AsnC family transcriptional regulator [Candidatus Nanoarchaeia archaeon]
MKELKLDKKDLDILAELDLNSRNSINQIAKKLKLSKDGVNYRIKKLIDNKIITRFFIDIDISKLGLILNKVTFQFQNITKDKGEEIFNFLKEHPKVGWVVFCSGRWDALVVIYVKNLYEYESVIKEINEKYGHFIHAKEFISHPRYYVCSRKWLSKNPRPKISEIGGKKEVEKVDNVDINIIKLLAENARIPIIDIAAKTKISPSLVIRRIGNLEKKGIILNYRIGLNLPKLGKEFCKSFIYLQNITRRVEKEIIGYCLNHPKVTAVTTSIGAWELELEMEVKNFEEFFQVMTEIKTKFKDYIKNYEAIVITKEYGIDYGSILSEISPGI